MTDKMQAYAEGYDYGTRDAGESFWVGWSIGFLCGGVVMGIILAVAFQHLWGMYK